MIQEKQDGPLCPVGSLRALLAGLIDYAGLFPPAGLSMSAAAANYAKYLAGSDSWALGRFVVLVSRLEELKRSRDEIGDTREWPLTVLISNPKELETALGFEQQHRGEFSAGSIETRYTNAQQLATIAGIVSSRTRVYVEVPVSESLEEALTAVDAWRMRAKIRAGGITPEMFPSPAEVARFLRVCAAQKIAFKATAGLHHPVRCVHALTYEPASPRGTMHGFLNVFVAAMLAFHGAEENELENVLREETAAAFTFTDEGVRWHDHVVTTAFVEKARREFAISFGSCSFEEPLGDLRQLGLLT